MSAKRQKELTKMLKESDVPIEKISSPAQQGNGFAEKEVDSSQVGNGVALKKAQGSLK